MTTLPTATSDAATVAADAATPSTSSLDLGVIGNCSFNALIDKLGRIVWCCLPRFDGDPVFNALLDPTDNGSLWSFQLENFSHSEQWYEANTAVLHTCLYDTLGQGVEITDFAPRFPSRGRFFRPLTIVRRIQPLSGAPRLRIVLRPRFDWGRELPAISRGSNHVRYIGAAQTLRLNTDAPISYLLAETSFVVSRPLNFILGPDEILSQGIGDTARHLEQETLAYWRSWSRALATPLEWQAAVIRAAITLKLSLYEDTGAIIAAMTTSVPEAPGSARNWDYRYCWLRDAFFVVRALNSLSELGTMEDYLRWLGNVVVRSAGGHVQPLYGIGLEEALPELVLDHLPGYRHHAPVRVGNQ
ncbi:glycoside hydrolase family 15 protein, partial [Collimonas sp.]|uniref:glycoside hydrolase family 15 protein n=1 Tax=Collimonas sp. TaxID=1963772 RepID=UPI002D02A67D